MRQILIDNVDHSKLRMDEKELERRYKDLKRTLDNGHGMVFPFTVENRRILEQVRAFAHERGIGLYAYTELQNNRIVARMFSHRGR